MSKLKDNLGLILILIGIILTFLNAFLGVIIIIPGVYFLNKKVNNTIQDNVKEKEEEIQGLDKQLEEKRQYLKNLNEDIGTTTKLINKTKELQEKEEKLKKIDKELNISHDIQNKQKELNKIEKELQKTHDLQNKDEELKNTKEHLENIKKEIQEKQKEVTTLGNQLNVAYNIRIKEEDLQQLQTQISKKKQELITLDEDINLQEIGFNNNTKYDFETAERYKEELKIIRQQQKQLIKDKTAAICTTEWTVNGSKREGKATTNANIKQILNNFNIECELVISKVTYRNRLKGEDNIRKIYYKLNKLNERNAIYITDDYLQLKIRELNLAIDYAIKKQEEKEALKEARAREKEERKVQKELEKREREIQKNKEKLQKQLEEEQKLLEKDKENQALQDKIRELQRKLEKQEEDQEAVQDRRKRSGAGFVYIISNIGSFGKDVYKIGVTRRDDPNARVNELSNASVPFRYDVNAFIYSTDAFALETELHQKFSKQRVNKVNNHKEFFRLTENDVKRVVDKYEDTVYNFSLKPKAEEYNETLLIEQQQ